MAYVVAVLEKSGIDVGFIDGVAEDLSIEAFVDAVKGIDPDIIAMECSTPSIQYDLFESMS